MLGLLKKIFGSKPTVNPCPEAPYKVEAPKVFVDGHGDAREAVVAEQATQAAVESIAKPSKKTPAKIKATPKKEAAPKKPGRKPKSKA